MNTRNLQFRAAREENGVNDLARLFMTPMLRDPRRMVEDYTPNADSPASQNMHAHLVNLGNFSSFMVHVYDAYDAAGVGGFMDVELRAHTPYRGILGQLVVSEHFSFIDCAVSYFSEVADTDTISHHEPLEPDEIANAPAVYAQLVSDVQAGLGQVPQDCPSCVDRLLTISDLEPR